MCSLTFLCALPVTPPYMSLIFAKLLVLGCIFKQWENVFRKLFCKVQREHHLFQSLLPDMKGAHAKIWSGAISLTPFPSLPIRGVPVSGIKVMNFNQSPALGTSCSHYNVKFFAYFEKRGRRQKFSTTKSLDEDLWKTLNLLPLPLEDLSLSPFYSSVSHFRHQYFLWETNLWFSC